MTPEQFCDRQGWSHDPMNLAAAEQLVHALRLDELAAPADECRCDPESRPFCFWAPSCPLARQIPGQLTIDEAT